jgi:asparagine synthase (glutamine-hydrolysing)
MTDSLSHRGPDGRGTYRLDHTNGSGVALGHRRLAIIDLFGGHQPMRSETVSLTFNGEIYNYRELRALLEGRGYVFQTDSDTETILHAYEAFGENFVDYLRGMFAIGLWDSRERKLVLARDRVGEKPLVFCNQGERLIFASEIKALLTIEGVGKQLRPEAIDQYLRYGYIPHPWTAYAGIEKLPPGHIGVYEQGRWRVRCYWQPPLATKDRLSRDDACSQLQHVAEEAVALRMRSDVPMGAFLSGGMDSTVIVGLMQQHAALPVKTFSLGFAWDDPKEPRLARHTARGFGVDHREHSLEPKAVESLGKLVEHFDEPFADSSAIATYYLSQWTSTHLRVALTGDGGDELFGGYARYQTLQRLSGFDRVPRFLKQLMTGPWIHYLPGRHPDGFASKLKHRLKILRESPEARYHHWITHFSRYQREAIYTPEYLKSCSFHENDGFLVELMRRFSAERPGIQAMRVDLHSYLPCDILAKVDITSMAHGLECRSPFLDHKLIEVVSAFPYDILYQPGKTKAILGRTFPRFIQSSMMRREKVGFTMPLSFWRQTGFLAMANDLLRSPNAFVADYVRTEVIESMLRQQRSGTVNHGERLWSLLFLEWWGRNAFTKTAAVEAASSPATLPIGATLSTP